MESHLRVEIVPRTSDGSPATARIGHAEFPILAYAVDLDDSGSPAVSLILQPDSLSIGNPPAATPPAPPAAQVSSWGDGSQPDPRESIPGWQPENLAEQVAGHAERVALRTWEPSDGQERPSAFKRLIRLGGEGGNVAVTA
jgi:hypothetical protein